MHAVLYNIILWPQTTDTDSPSSDENNPDNSVTADAKDKTQRTQVLQLDAKKKTQAGSGGTSRVKRICTSSGAMLKSLLSGGA